MTSWPSAVAALLLILTAGGAAVAEPLALSASRVVLEPGQNGTSRTGSLIWRGGLVLSSGDRRFGGLSGLLVEPDGRRLLAVSDKGRAIAFTLRYDETGDLAGAEAGEILTLADTGGRPLGAKRESDSESLVLLPDGSILVGFEHHHRLLRYPAADKPFARPPAPFPAPPGLARAADNAGLEALALLGDGRLLAVLEGREAETETLGFLRGDGHWSSLRLAREGLFRPTGATRLPDGRIALLERRFTVLGGPAARVVVFDPEALKPGALVAGREIGRLVPPFPVDNMEGIAARLGDRGETLIYLVSDDNFFAMQRTLLLMFELGE